MRAVLLDTHAWAWTLTGDSRLSPRALGAIGGAGLVLVSPVSFFEIGQKVRLGKWPEMEPTVDQLPQLLVEQGGSVATLEPVVCLRAALLDWSHRDPFDRLLAASALHYDLPLISADIIFDGLVTRIW